jgi:MFS family permease
LTLGLVLLVGAVAFEALAVATVLPTTVADLGGLELYGWAFSAFMLTNLVGITVGGSEADASGPTGPFLVGVTLFALGLAIDGVAPAMPVVVAGRAVQGMGAGLLSAVSYVCIGRAYDGEAKPRMLAILSSAWVVPGLVGPALAGLIADHAGWRWVFLGLVPLPPLAALLAVPAMRRLAPSGGAARDTGRTWTSIRLALGAGALLTGFEAESVGVSSGLVVAGCAVGGAALNRLLPPGTARAQRGLPAAVATMGLLNFGFFGTEAFLPLGLTSVRGQSATVTGLALTAATIAWTAGAWLQVRLSRSTARRHVVSGGLVLLAFGIGGVAIALLPSVRVALAAVSWGVAGLGMGLAFSTTSLAVLEAAPPGQEGGASASMQLAQVLGIALATGLGGAIVAAAFAGTPPRFGIALIDVLMAATVVLALWAARGIVSGSTAPSVGRR